MQRVNLGSGDLETDGSRSDRIAPPAGAECRTGRLRNRPLAQPGAAIDPAGFVLGTVPRNLDDVRTPHRNNWDFVGQPRTSPSAAAMRGQIKLEVLNMTNTPKVRGPITTVGSSTFGQIRVQAGFMRADADDVPNDVLRAHARGARGAHGEALSWNGARPD